MNFAWNWRRGLAVSLALAFVCYAGPFSTVRRAEAQVRAEAVSIAAPRVVEIAPGSETLLPIQLEPSTAVPRRSILLIRGLPTTMTLSGGRLFESGVWGVASADIADLTISSSSTASGKSELIISLVSLDGSIVAETTANLVVRAASTPAAAKTDFGDQALLTATAPQELPRREPAPAPARRLSGPQTEQLLAMVRKADDQMRVGDISAARLLYRHAAEAGLAAAAMALAATYDDQELRKHHVLGGVRADAKQAQFWYEKARELGSPDARERLQRLGSR